MALLLRWLTLLAVVLAACEPAEPPTTDRVRGDAGAESARNETPPGGGTPDGGTPVDGGTPIDSGTPIDGGTAIEVLADVVDAFAIASDGDEGTSGASGPAPLLIPWATSRSGEPGTFAWGTYDPGTRSFEPEQVIAHSAQAWMVRAAGTDFFLFGPNKFLPIPNPGGPFHLAGRRRGSAAFDWALPLDAREADHFTASTRGDRACAILYPEDSMWGDYGQWHSVVCADAQGTVAWTRRFEPGTPSLRGRLIIQAARFIGDDTLLLGGSTFGDFEIDGRRYEAPAGAAILVALDATTGAHQWAQVVAAQGTVAAVVEGATPQTFTAVVAVDPGATIRWGNVSRVAPPGVSWSDGTYFIIQGDSAGSAASIFDAGRSNSIRAPRVAAAPDGALLAAWTEKYCVRAELRSVTSEGVVRVRQLRAESCEHDPEPAGISSIHLGRDGEYVLVGNFGGTLHLSTGTLRAAGAWDVFVITVRP